jgi:hypothetical protein
MKYLNQIIFFIAIITLWSCDNKQIEISTDLINNPATAQTNKEIDKNILPQIQFEKTSFDFGLIMQGEQVEHKYKFKNTGGADLIISNVSANCGCTIPTYSKEPIAPGKEGYIKVVFDSEGRGGLQHKTITILANTQPNRIKLTFTVDIEVPNN